MTKRRKTALIIVLSAVGAVIVAVAAAFFCSAANQPEEFFVTSSAKSAAAAYIKEKYGDSPPVQNAEPVYSGGFMFDKGTLRGAVVHFNGFDVLAADDRLTDNRQYGEIVDAFTKKYLSLTEIYSDIEECSAAFDFGVTVSSKNYPDFNSRFFDGDISDFLGKTAPKLTLKLEGRGFHEKRAETPDLLRKILEAIRFSTEGEIRAYAYVSDPEIELPDMPLECSAYNLMFPPKRYDDYMELIAAGRIVRDESVIEQPCWYAADEFTSISDNNIDSHITSERDFFCTAKDFSENQTVYRGRFKYDDHAEENILTVRENGLFCGVNARSHDFMLRLDREHYGITDNTIALRITPPVTAEEWSGKQLYISFGYDGYDTDSEHWYYMDEKYLYLYVPYMCHDLFGFEEDRGVYIAFADIDARG